MFGLIRKKKYKAMEEKLRHSEAAASYWKNRCEEYYNAMNIMETELESYRSLNDLKKTKE